MYSSDNNIIKFNDMHKNNFFLKTKYVVSLHF